MLHGLPEKFQEQILASLSTSLPLGIVADLIADEGYWRRRATATFKLCDPEQHGDSWKRLYFELNVQALLEAYYPRHSPYDGEAEDMKRLETELVRAAPYVKRVYLRQLKPAHGLDTSTPELKDIVVDSTQPHPDHLHPDLLFKHLPNMTELSLHYGWVMASSVPSQGSQAGGYWCSNPCIRGSTCHGSRRRPTGSRTRAPCSTAPSLA